MYEEQPFEEEQLMRQVRQNPELGLAAAIAAYGGLVQAVCRRILGAGQEDVEECVAEVFWRLYQNAEAWQPGRSLKSWLCGIARHVALDRLRSLARRPEQPTEDFGLIADPRDLVEQLEAADRERLVQECVEELGEPDRQIFICRYFWGEKPAAIARRLKLDAKAVENRLYRGRQRLRRALLERGISL